MLSEMLKKVSLPVVPFISAVAAFIAVATAPMPAHAQFLYHSDLPKVSTPWADFPYDSVLSKTWQGIYKSLVGNYGTGMVHRPKSNSPDDAVSEGISYGMFLALYMNDQAKFNEIWDAGEKFMLEDGGKYYHWRTDPSGGVIGTGAASDADQDIALLLIFADKLVKSGHPNWKTYKSSKNATYEERAQILLDNVLNTMTITRQDNDQVGNNRYLLPWPGAGNHINPGYFAPAFYRVFAEYDVANADKWMALVRGSYEVIENSSGYGKGLLMDWCKFDGSSTIGGTGYNGYRGGVYQYRDAIRVYWRLATDYLWYKEPRAKEFLDNAMAFAESPSAANFYDMDGKLPPEEDVEILAFEHPTREVVRSRREHSHLTLGMWAAAAMGTGNLTLAKDYSDALLGFYTRGTTYWGLADNPASAKTITNATAPHPTNEYADPITYPSLEVREDTAHNEMYFDQFLAWFGASILAGNFTNVWEDLKDGIPSGPLAWKTRPPPILPNWNIGGSTVAPYNEVSPFVPFRIGASFTRSTNWTVTFTHDAQPSNKREFSNRSDTVDVVWHGVDKDGNYMPQGWYTLTIAAGSLRYGAKVWLGRAGKDRPDLMIGTNRLLVDDFKDKDVYPYIGKVWSVTTGGGSTASISFPATAERMTWSYSLENQYEPATLDWTTDEIDVSGGTDDKLVIWASGQNAPLDVWLHILSAHFSLGYDKFFEHTFTLSGTSQRIEIPLKAEEFKQREYVSGNEIAFSEALKRFTGFRFHMQGDMTSSATGSITLDSVIFVGSKLSSIYKPQGDPPAYSRPSGEPEIVGIAIRQRAKTFDGFSMRKVGNSIRMTIPKTMSGASVSIVDIRGRTVKRVNVPQSGHVNISTKELAAGMYFVEVKKRGARAIRVPLNNVR